MAKSRSKSVAPVVVKSSGEERKLLRQANGALGHKLTGKSKPTGRTVGGHSLKKLEAKQVSVERIAESRDTRHRAQLRRDRKVAARLGSQPAEKR